MTILSAQGVRRQYGDRWVLDGATLSLDAGQRVGVVGRNGSGKSTLARILAGVESPDEGEVVMNKGLRVGYLEQQPQFVPGSSVLEATMSGLSEWQDAMSRYEEVSNALSSTTDADKLESLLHEQADSAADVEKLGGWELQHEAHALLEPLGFDDTSQCIDTLSGGEKRRVALARLLIARPDLAILDEPTNHLDLTTIEWMERYLTDRYQGAILLVTHDRYLLEKLTNRTLEVADGVVHSYQGGWLEYLEAKAEREAHAGRTESNRQNFLRRELEWYRRQPKARTTKSRSRMDRIESVMDVAAPSAEKEAKLKIDTARSGKTILDVKELCLDMGDRRLVDHLTMALQQGERIGIVGPNGCGKTTLLRALLGELEPNEGSVTIGKNTKIAYLNQTREGMDPETKVYDAFANGRGTIVLGTEELSIRAYLERFLFDTSGQQKKIGTLSGGEKARVALALVLSEQANVVVLDEPTNDLDVTTLTSLEASLVEFTGSTLVVTHDRWFLDRVATTILAFDPLPGESGSQPRCKVVRYEGNYSSYRRKRDEALQGAPESKKSKRGKGSASVPAPVVAAKPPVKKLTFKEKKELDGMMAKIEATEEAVSAAEEALKDPAFFNRAREEQTAFLAELEQKRKTSEQLVERWEELEARQNG